MSTAEYKPRRQGLTYPPPTSQQWRRILRKCKHVNTGYDSPCWIWLGRIDTDGYGECKYNGEKRFVHRIAYARANGKAPGSKDIDHVCHQMACCNPAHLRALPPDINAGDHGEQPLQANKNNYLDFAQQDVRLEPVPF